MRKNLLSKTVIPDSLCSSKQKKTILEKRVPNLLSQYNIEYYENYELYVCGKKYVFNFYVWEYRILIITDYNESEMESLVFNLSDYHIIFVKSGKDEPAIKELRDVLQKKDPEIFNYEGEVYKQCRQNGFPYPDYTDRRMLQDWGHLCMMSTKSYTPHCRFGISIIGNFHRSIYDCSVEHLPTPVEGWNDDNILKYVITNRFIYQDTVNPSKVRSGLNICKRAPIVSRFNPTLARYLTKNYLDEFDTVFDPFSGFSGRLMGVSSCDKRYIGQDLNENAVRESNQIIKYLNLKNIATVEVKNILDSFGTYECLLTCPPYSDKEVYNHEEVFKSCDDWINECLNRFSCKRYIFVVDKTEKYKDNVVMTLQNSSHFSSSTELVIVIDSN